MVVSKILKLQEERKLIRLYEVRNQLSSATGENNRSVIVFTDGQPGNKGFNTSYNDYDDNGYRVGAEALNQADFIKLVEI